MFWISKSLKRITDPELLRNMFLEALDDVHKGKDLMIKLKEEIVHMIETNEPDLAVKKISKLLEAIP